MTLWFVLKANLSPIGTVDIRRRESLDLATDVSSAVSTYEVTLDNRLLGTVEHRYGDGPWVLLRKAVTLIEVTKSR